MTNPTPFVKCPHCIGTGRIELSGVYLETLKRLRRYPDGIHAAALAKAMGCEPTAMNNRLAYLEEHSLVVSVRDGRKRVFAAQ